MSADVGWRSLHVHRFANQDALLVDGLAPLLARLRDQGLVERSFFLRYWEGGHHIRVRVRTDPTDSDAVTAQLTEGLSGYLRAHPDDASFDLAEFMREAQPTMAALEGTVPGEIYPPDTVRVAAYHPEYDKYGGPGGVAIAEEFFDRSSGLALTALAELGGRHGRRLGLAFVMMVRGLCGAGLSAADQAAFFSHYCALWSPYVFDTFLSTWPELLARRREPVSAQARRTLAEPALTDGYSAAVQAAIAAVAADPTVLPAVSLAGVDADTARRQQVLLVSYLHTHNNRLGLTPEQEAFLGFLGHHALSECAGSAPDTELVGRVRTFRAHRLRTLTTTV
jgi:thiopeptide-type bacteriocin biosynthesis protein